MCHFLITQDGFRPIFTKIKLVLHIASFVISEFGLPPFGVRTATAMDPLCIRRKVVHETCQTSESKTKNNRGSLKHYTSVSNLVRFNSGILRDLFHSGLTTRRWLL